MLTVFFLFLNINRVVAKKAAISRLISSFIPRVNTADNPIIDQINGIIIKAIGNFLSVHKSNPNVKIVVGQGKPKVGEDG